MEGWPDLFEARSYLASALCSQTPTRIKQKWKTPGVPVGRGGLPPKKHDISLLAFFKDFHRNKLFKIYRSGWWLQVISLL